MYFTFFENVLLLHCNGPAKFGLYIALDVDKVVVIHAGLSKWMLGRARLTLSNTKYIVNIGINTRFLKANTVTRYSLLL